MGKNSFNNSFELALSGISCAVAVIFLALGILSDWLIATGYFMGVVAMMAPLSKQFIKGSFLAYLGTCILTVIMGAAAKFWDLVPFIMFFGLHPILNALQLKYKINKWLAWAVKAVWFDCTLIVGYFLIYEGVLGGEFLPAEFYEIVNKYIYAFIFTVGTAVFFVYDYVVFKCQITVNRLVGIIRK